MDRKLRLKVLNSPIMLGVSLPHCSHVVAPTHKETVKHLFITTLVHVIIKDATYEHWTVSYSAVCCVALQVRMHAVEGVYTTVHVQKYAELYSRIHTYKVYIVCALRAPQLSHWLL